MAGVAEGLATPDAPASNLRKAALLATDALRRDPTVVPAIRTLGVVADLAGSRRRALALFGAAQQASRRDLPTQLWLIEEAVGRDDSRGALAHFDIALRSSHRATALLFPVLVAATEDARLVEPIAAILAARPWWATGYLVNLTSKGKDTANIVEVLNVLDARRVPISEEVTVPFSQRLVAENRFDEAWSVYRIGNPHARLGILQNGNFARDSIGMPFDWTMNTNIEPFSGRVADEGDGVMNFEAASGTGGEIARQLVIASPGYYRFTGTAAGVAGTSDGALALSVQCANVPPRLLVSQQLSALPQAAASFSASFRVPAEACPAIWIRLNVSAANDGGTTEGRVDNLVLREVAP